ncbi:MAG: hypothetical protein CBC22_00720 [Alphaproteobacteria bacterium TMED62]|nr:MAG: hypothetical protein CBC22_00720 [Alphaproteobacteria bacterium TMED62]
MVILTLVLNLKLYAGAPAPNTSLPLPPYKFEKGTLLTINVEWEKNSLKKYLSEDIIMTDTLKGGIDIYFTKHKKPLARIDYALMWIDQINEEKNIILAFVGPSYDSNRLIEKISEKKLTLSKSRLMQINNKVSFRTNVNNKLVFNLSGDVNDKCTSHEKKSKKISKNNNNKFFIISNSSDLICELNNIKLKFSEEFKELKVNKILSGSLFKNTELIFED